jgi:hypothetical protein
MSRTVARVVMRWLALLSSGTHGSCLVWMPFTAPPTAMSCDSAARRATSRDKAG